MPTMDCSILRIFLLLSLILTFARSDLILSTDGEYVDCVNRKEQPAFDHPLLQNHRIQESPSEIPRSMIRTKSKRQTRQAHVSTANCPEGTVPVRQDSSDMAQTNTDDTAVHEHAVIKTIIPPKLYGAKATINVWKPMIEKGADEMSVSQIWITSGEFNTDDLNTIEVGWQVYPSFYLDKKPRLFIFWTSDGYKTTGCYNLRCAGFIQTSSTIVIGGSISPISVFNGKQSEMSVFVWKDPKHGNWWLSLGPDNVLVGYWPAEIFTTLADHAVQVQWGGEITNAQTFGRHTTTQMGSGFFPDEGFGKASYFRNLEIVDHNNSLQCIQSIHTEVEKPKLYDVNNHFTDDWGDYFFYGGPRLSHSGALRLSLYSSFVYFSFSFLFIILIL